MLLSQSLLLLWVPWDGLKLYEESPCESTRSGWRLLDGTKIILMSHQNFYPPVILREMYARVLISKKNVFDLRNVWTWKSD